MKRATFIQLTFLFCLFFFSCDEGFDELRDFPEVITQEVGEITALGATFSAKLKVRNNPQIEKHGFVWAGTGAMPTLVGASYEISFSGSPVNLNFTATISTNLEKGKEYIVRAYVIANGITVYGNHVTFKSLGSSAPVVNDFNPKSGTWGDIISFYGKYFSNVPDHNEVLFNNIQATSITANDTLVTVQVPSEFLGSEAILRFSVSGNNAVKNMTFKYKEPKVILVSPLQISFNDTITLLGSDFNPIIANTFVFIDNLQAKIISLSEFEIKAIIPAGLIKTEVQVKVKSAGYEVIYPELLVLNKLKIITIDSDTITRYSEIVTIYGENFSPIPTNNVLTFNVWYNAQILESSNTHIKAVLPKEIITNYHITEHKDFEIELKVAGQSVTHKLFLKWNSTWTRKKDFPGEARYGAIAFSLMNIGYYGLGISDDFNYKGCNDIWQYDEKFDTWHQLPNYPGGDTYFASSFSLNDKGYVLGGTYSRNTSNGLILEHRSAFMRLDPEIRSWESIAPYPGKGRAGLTCISLNNTALVGAGYRIPDPNYHGDIIEYKDFWIYDPIKNSWEETIPFDHVTSMSPGFFAGNNAYVFSDQSLYELNENNWTKISNRQFYSWRSLSFVIGNTGYYGLGLSNYHLSSGLFAYNTDTGMTIFYPFANNLSNSSVFVIDEKAYLIGGYDIYKPYKAVWEFDPSKPEP